MARKTVWLGLAIAVLVVISQGNVLGYSGEQVAVKDDTVQNAFVITLTMPTVVLQGEQYPVKVEWKSTDPNATCCQWSLYEDSVSIAGSGFAPLEGSYTTTRTASAMHSYYAKGRSIGGAHGWPPYAQTITLWAYQDMHEGISRGSYDERQSFASTVDVGSGNLNLDYQLTHIVPTNNLPHNFTLYYNSLDVATDWPVTDTVKPLGPKWTHNFNQCLRQNGNTIIHIAPDGRRVFYNDPLLTNVSFSELPQYGGYSTISWTGNTYILTQKDRTVLTFDSAGILLSITDRNNNSVTLDYVDSKLSVINLPNGRTINLSYWSGTSLIQYVTAPAPGSVGSVTITLNYDTGVLLNLYDGTTGSGTWRRDFTYLPGNLIRTVTEAISAGQSNLVTYGYDANNRCRSITKQINGTDRTRYFDYTSAVQTAIGNYEGFTSTVTYSYTIASLQTELDAAGNLITRTFDASGNLLSLENARGYITRYEYNTQGNLISATDTTDCTTQYFYEDPVNPDLPSRIINPLGITTALFYDERGNLTGRADGLGSDPDISQVISYTYYAQTDPNKGKLYEEIRHPVSPTSTATQILTRYTYTANGYLWKKAVDPDGLNIIYEYSYYPSGQVERAYNPYTTSANANTYYQYDDRGNNTRLTDPATVVTEFGYNLMDNLIQRTDNYGGSNPGPVVTRYDRDNLGRLTSTVVDYGGLNITTNADYDLESRVISTTDPAGATTEYDYLDNGWLNYINRRVTDTGYAYTYYFYDANGNKTGQIDPEGHSISYTYNTLDKLENIQVWLGAGISQTTTYIYDLCGCCAASTVRDPRGNETYTKYNDLKQVELVRGPAPQYITTKYVYDRAGRNTEVIGPWEDTGQTGNPPAGAPRRYTVYDKADRIVRIYTNTAGHAETNYGYDVSGNTRTIIDPVNAVTVEQYDDNNRLDRVTVDPGVLNEQTKYTYDNLGRQTEIIAAYGTASATTTTSVYDNASRVISSYTGSVLYATHYRYNQRGQQTLVTDANGNTTGYEYELGGALKRTTNALGHYVDYAYDKDGNRISVTYYRSITPGLNAVTTNYTYYANHLLESATYPGFSGANNNTNWYDGNGNLYRKLDANGNDIYYDYDAYNRLLTKTCGSSVTGYGYDALGNILSTKVNGSLESENSYDDLGQLITATNRTFSPYKIVGYAYYEDGTRSAMTSTDSSLVTYTYDKAKRLKTVDYNGANAATYNYNVLGLRQNLNYGNGAYANYTYDDVTRWLTGVTNKKGTGGATVSSFTYTHDLVANRQTMTLVNGDVITYTYDAGYQLTSELRTGATAYSIAWAYDGLGNRLAQNKGGVWTNYAYNDANQLISDTVNSTTTLYGYDANGNMTAKSAGVSLWNWAYNFENKQISHTDSSRVTSYYSYDVAGRRVSKDANGVLERYLYDGANAIADYNWQGVIQTAYITPFLDQNLMMVRGADKYYFMQDGLGSVRNIMDSQNTRKTYDYYAFGELLSETPNNNNLPNRYRYTSRE
jgi:YD repeat-containing protein